MVCRYSLRHGGNYKADSLRTWDFQVNDYGRDTQSLVPAMDDGGDVL